MVSEAGLVVVVRVGVLDEDAPAPDLAAAGAVVLAGPDANAVAARAEALGGGVPRLAVWIGPDDADPGLDEFCTELFGTGPRQVVDW